MNVSRVLIFTATMSIIIAPCSSAAPIAPGNILIGTSEVLYEYTPGGAFVQSFPIPDGSGTIPNPDTARDIAMKTGSNEVHVFNGTFTPSLSTLDTGTSLWSHQTFAGWSTVNNISYGGLAVGGVYVFATDMATAGVGAPQGIVRFDSGGGSTRLATGIDPIDLNIGQNGTLYALDGQLVFVYDPESLVLQQTIDLDATIAAGDYRAVAANASGELFIVDWAGNLYKTDSTGNVIDSVNLSGTAASINLSDVDVSDQGGVVVGDAGGGVTVTDESFTAPSNFTVGSTVIFVAIPSNPPVGLPLAPETSFIVCSCLLAVGLLMLHRETRRGRH